MDDERLENPPGPGPVDYFDELLERIRDIHSSERRFYQKRARHLRDEHRLRGGRRPDDEVLRHRSEQDALGRTRTHGGRGHPSAGEFDKPLMGLQTTRPGGIVRKDDVAIAKNYLTEPGLQVLNRIVNLYMKCAELQALERNPMTMRYWIKKLDEFLKVSGRKLLDHARTTAAEAAKAKAELEYNRYRAFLDTQPRAIDVAFEKTAKELKKLPSPKKPKRGKS